MIIRHECDGVVAVAVTEQLSCSACGLNVAPAKRAPTPGHGVVRCTANGHLMAACPLGETEAEMLEERARAGG